MRLRHIPKERIFVLGQHPNIDHLEWQKQCFEVKSSKKKDQEPDKKESDRKKDEEASKEQGEEKSDDPSIKEKPSPKETAPPRPKDPKVDKEIPMGFDPKSTSDPGSESQDPKDFQTPKSRKSNPPPKSGGDSQTLIDPLKLTPLSKMESRSESLEDVMSLSNYKFDRSHFPIFKWTLKHRKIIVGSIEKPITEGFEESTLQDISSPYVTQVGIETSATIVRMALSGQTSTEAMEKEIARLKQSPAQFQAELIESARSVLEGKRRSLDKLKIALELKHEQEIIQLTGTGNSGPVSWIISIKLTGYEIIKIEEKPYSKK